jgi:3-oxoacyl-[acyl-carrier protein] reductase
MDLRNQIAIVTGAGQGMGRGIAELLASYGVMVVVAGRTESKVRETADAIEKAGGGALAVAADISKIGDIRRMFEICLERLGAPDILVANAGLCDMAPITEVTEEHYHSIYDVNAKGTLFCLKEAGLKLNDGGRIVVISSSSVRYPEKGMAVYSSAKAAVQLMVEVAAQEFSQRGITVNSVMAGLTETPNMLVTMPERHRLMIIEKTPFKRLASTNDIAEVVAFLSSKNARWITGQHILANGGCLSID